MNSTPLSEDVVTPASAEDGSETHISSETGPGQVYAIFLSMESLLDKLKLLNYDKDFVMALKMKPLNRYMKHACQSNGVISWLTESLCFFVFFFCLRHYFAIQTNPGEQFYLFTSLAAWLIRKSGESFDQPQEYDDPNSTIFGILDTARKKVSDNH